jgi:malate dehydrogenase (oxaloacetate-decarboxylating)
VAAERITPEMKIAAARALADAVREPQADKILPSPLDPSVAPLVAKAVARAAKE